MTSTFKILSLHSNYKYCCLIIISLAMCTTQRNSWLTSRRCWRISSCLCLKSRSIPVVILSYTSSWTMWVPSQRKSKLWLWKRLIPCPYFFFSARWSVSTAWTMSLNPSTTFSILTVRFRPTGQKKTTHPTPTTSTTPMPTWLCSTTCESTSLVLFYSLAVNTTYISVSMLFLWSDLGGVASTRLCCDLIVVKRGQFTTWCQVSCYQRTSLMGCCLERYRPRVLYCCQKMFGFAMLK